MSDSSDQVPFLEEEYHRWEDDKHVPLNSFYDEGCGGSRWFLDVN